MKRTELNEKTCAIVRELVWKARCWSAESRNFMRRYRAETAKPFPQQNIAGRMRNFDEAYRYKCMRREVMKAARKVAETFGMPCAKRTAREMGVAA